MSRKQSGFTLIELMIVIAIIAVIAAIAIPNLLAARLAANETAAIATLRNLVSAQAQFQQGGRLDVDGDGTGEYGFFQELAGTDQTAGRMASTLVPPVLPGAFRTVDATGIVSKSGYLFKIWLPDNAGVGQAEEQTTVLAAAVDPDLAETVWCAYAWPASYNQSGNRTFFVNQAGEVLGGEGTANQYNGTTTSPTPDAAYMTATDIRSRPDIGGAGQATPTGFTWVQVG